jgi:type II secretory pathway pseudopilin PulG
MNACGRKAFTLVELLLAVTIIIVVAAAIVPMISSMSGGSRVKGALNEIQGFLMMARQEAVQSQKEVAVFFLPPTRLTPSSRAMLFQLRANHQVSESIGDWVAMAGSYGIALAPGLEVRNGADADLFCIIFNSRGYVHRLCGTPSTCIKVQPKQGQESREQPLTAAVNRATGAFLRFERIPPQ